LRHCRTKEEAEALLERLKVGMLECKLEIHQDKTRIVYCKVESRKKEHEHTSFTFLGYEFRPRIARSRNGRYFLGFSPAVSHKQGRVSVNPYGKFGDGQPGWPWRKSHGE